VVPPPDNRLRVERTTRLWVSGKQKPGEQLAIFFDFVKEELEAFGQWGRCASCYQP